MVSSEDEEEGWVPLENTFASQERGEGEEPDGEGPVFSVSRGASDAQIAITFVGTLDGGEEESELTEEISFERLSALHRWVCLSCDSHVVCTRSCSSSQHCPPSLPRQMMDLFPDKIPEDLLPQLPTVPRGLWSYLMSVEIPAGLYDDLASYFAELAARCSLRSTLDVVFENAFWTPDRYEAAWSDINRRHYEEEREGLASKWAELMERRSSTAFTSMQQLHGFYDEEDELVYELNRVEQRLYGFQARPFEDLGEISRRRRDQAAQLAKDDDRSVSARLQALREERELHETYLEACESLHELALERLQSEAGRLEAVCQRMSEDRGHVGRDCWDRRAASRLDRTEDKLNRVIVELLQRQVRRLADQKDRALLAMALVEEGPGMEEEVAQCERVVFRVQLQMYEIQLRLLEEEERKLRLQARYAEGEGLTALQRHSKAIPSKMSKIRLKMVTSVCVCVLCDGVCVV